jgi:Uma2 family endonuclease
VRKALDARLTGKAYRPSGPNVKILVAGRVRYPDAIVTCSPGSPDATSVENPVIVFEVISDDTARTDRVEKLREYQATPSIRRYVILEQKSIGATVFAREESFWSAAPLAEGETLELPEIEASIPLAEFYAGLELPPLPEG